MSMRRYLDREIVTFDALPERSVWEQYTREAKPFVARNAFDPTLSIQAVRELAGSVDVVVHDQVLGPAGYGEATLAELIDCLDQVGSIWYARQQALPPPLEPFIPEMVKKVVGKDARPNMWLGARGSYSLLHRDLVNNVILQCDGAKEFTLISPMDDAFVYPRPGFRQVADFSQIGSVKTVDLAAFPRFRDAKPIVIELRAGDALYVPPFWWHEVHSLEHNLMINCWWRASLDVALRGEIQEVLGSSEQALNLIVDTVVDPDMTDVDLALKLAENGFALLGAVVLATVGEYFVRALRGSDGFTELLSAAALYPLRESGRIDDETFDLLQRIRLAGADASAGLGKRPPYREFTTEALAAELTKQFGRRNLTVPSSLRKSGDAAYKQPRDASQSLY
jgi:hypothetical protein